MCRVIEVSKSGYYDWLNRKPSKRKQYNFILLCAMKEVHFESEEVYGAERIHNAVQLKGFVCGIRLIERLMKVAKISSKIKAKYRCQTTDSNHDFKISPNILDRNFRTTKPNEAWVSDITYVEVGGIWMYLCTIMDLFNREIIGWSLERTLETSLLIKTFEKAVQLRKPKAGCKFHSDRGVQYASHEFRRILEKYNMIQSMSRKGNCWDNAPAESFFKTIKVERIYHRHYLTIEEARSDLFEYIEIFYNRIRLHSYLGFTNPVEFGKMYYKKVA